MTEIDSVSEMMCMTNFTMRDNVPNIGNFILWSHFIHTLVEHKF